MGIFKKKSLGESSTGHSIIIEVWLNSKYFESISISHEILGKSYDKNWGFHCSKTVRLAQFQGRQSGCHQCLKWGLVFLKFFYLN